MDVSNPLLQALRSRNSTLADQAARLIRESARFLDYTFATFPSFTEGAVPLVRSIAAFRGAG